VVEKHRQVTIQSVIHYLKINLNLKMQKMKQKGGKLKQVVKSLLAVSIGLFFMNATLAQEPCNRVDLQGVSIDPIPGTIKKGQTASIVVVMKNNGPCIIPKGDATAQVTLIGEFLEPGGPVNFIDICGQWSYLGVISKDGHHDLFFQNNAGAIPLGGQYCYFQFDVIGKADTKPASGITLVSTLGATSMMVDMNGRNQAASTELKVTSSALPFVMSDFGVTATGCTANLSWKTSAEKNVTRFEVEHSTDGYQYTTAGTVPAKKNAGGASYSYAYEQGAGIAYYRPKIIEKGEQFSHSKIISIDTKCAPKKGFNP
jgi:hypothetical protein